MVYTPHGVSAHNSIKEEAMKNKVWKYCRQACPDETLSGIQGQSERLDRYITENGLVPVGESKVVESGSTTNRDSLRALLNEAKRGTYDILLIDGIDRISRNRVKCGKFCRKLLDTGIRIVSVGEQREITKKDFAMLDIGIDR